MHKLQAKVWNAVGVSLQPILHVAEDTGVLGRVPLPRTVLPVPHEPLPATSNALIDAHLQALDEHKQQWVRTDTATRARMLAKVQRNTAALASQLAAAGTAAKGAYEGGVGEDL
jgi:acyl-CoA reductase-like NAD-dependent aldehyde dehydrogenase